MRGWFSWILACLGVFGASIAGMWWWDRKRWRMGYADERRLKAARQIEKAEDHDKKAVESDNLADAQRHLLLAAEARGRADQLEKERIALAKELAQDMEDSERVRRFNERHGLVPPP